MEMELKGIDASISNALRRIIIAEIPTMAFHKVFLYQNTSVLPD
jgi:DNA-directed RNA polymerase I and III subunit RPAC1